MDPTDPGPTEDGRRFDRTNALSRRKSGVRSQESGVRSQESGVKSQESEVGRQEMRNSRGVALLMVLWVLTLFMVLVAEFALSMRTEARASAYYQDGTRGYYLARAGVFRALLELQRTQQRDQASLPSSSEEPALRPNLEPQVFQLPGGACEVRAGDEAGKMNLNQATDAVLRNLLGAIGLAGAERDVVADAILDWRDADDHHRLSGAEKEYYRALPEPYEPRNGNFESVEELLLVKGVTPELFYGRIVTLPSGETRAMPGLRDLVTVYTDTAQINVNSAPREILLAVPSMTEAVADAIIAYRKARPFKSTAEMEGILGKLGGDSLGFSPSNLYALTATGRAGEGGVRHTVRAIVKVGEGPQGYRILHWVDRVM
jgi:general secretion pathway protein K